MSSNPLENVSTVSASPKPSIPGVVALMTMKIFVLLSNLTASTDPSVIASPIESLLCVLVISVAMPPLCLKIFG